MSMSIADDLLKAFSQHASRTAISESGNNISYYALQQQCFKVAGYINRLKLKNAFIAIEVDNITDHIIAVLGVAISGNCYISVTPENSAFVNHSHLPIALKITSTFNSNNCIAIDDILRDDVLFNVGDISIHGEMNLCTFFTSGSTGQSKVIIHQHKNIFTDTWRQINDNNITQADKIDLVFSLSFSASLACIYPALLTGAELCIFDLKTEGLIQLAHFWQRKAISFSTLSVTSFHGICKMHPSLQHLTALRFISISAEPVKDTTIRMFQSTFGAGVILQIAYASTETRTVSEMKVTNTGAPLIFPDAIGKPVSGKTVHIVDPDGHYLPADYTGEIVVESEYIARGYYGQPEESAHSFTIKNNLVYYKTGDLGCFNKDGYLFYRGRLNNQYKLNGIKINLLDIEQQVEKTAGVFKAAVVINTTTIEQPKLTCFYETVGELNVNANFIKQTLAQQLPASHVPHFFINLPQIPLTHSGKTDRKQLELFNLKTYLADNVGLPHVMGVDEQEQVIADIFANILQLPNIGPDTDFFDAGGDSMSTMVCIADIEAALNKKISTTALITNSTPKKLSLYLNQQNEVPLLIKKIVLNQHHPTKKNLYFLNNEKKNLYSNLINSPLMLHFNLTEVVYDMLGSNYTNPNYPQQVMDYLVEITRHDKEAIFIGHSFNGFVAHQLSCLASQISYCILIDTHDYFEYDKYVTKKSKTDTLRLLSWHFFVNKDFLYPALHLLNSVNYRLSKKKQENPDKKRLRKIKVKNINMFLSALNHTKAPKNCIYFQASRNRGHIGKSWASKFAGKFYYKSLIATHSNIISTKAGAMADFIIKTVGIDK